MNLSRINEEARLEARQTRAKTAKKLARVTKLGLLGLCLTAIWQERALAPNVHDRMQTAYAAGAEWLENSETGGGYVSAMSGFSGNGNQSEHNAITRALLKLRQ